MDRNAAPRKRRQDAPQPTTKPPIRLPRDKSVKRPVSSGRIRLAKDSSEFIRVPRRAGVQDPETREDNATARHFVANVDRNGALELRPSRMQPSNLSKPPATPPTTSNGARIPWDDALAQRQSNMSGTWTPPPPRRAAFDHSMPMPPLSMTNPHQRRRTRSASFSTVNTLRRETTDSADFQLLLNGRDATTRPKSSIDIAEGLIDMRIPHYRLGTPRFSDRGTAYLHNSMYTMASTVDDMRSSVWSRAEFDRLFPAPPGRERAPTAGQPRNSSPYLHPSTAASYPPTRTSASPVSNSGQDKIMPALYDDIAANLHDASQVRYASSTGRIIAATTGRLVTQITSPMFLDYELLADFFLTFRSFLSTHECLAYLMARMEWALLNNNDAGRIVRVRSFVALRHWILNYFSDDFLSDYPLRDRFCHLVNEHVHALRQRSDHGGSEVNVMGELKKCWRRTCAMHWPVAEGLATSPDVDIHPGEEISGSGFGASATSLPLTVRHNGSRLDFRRSSVIQLLVASGDETSEKPVDSLNQAPDPRLAYTRTRTASIPTSPMSQQSLEVLSCSIPFLRSGKAGKKATGMGRSSVAQKHPPLSAGTQKIDHVHKRSGSFTDALRDKRPPLPSGRPQSIDLNTLREYTFTGGLVRGLLLQPSPSKVELLIPLSPYLDSNEPKHDTVEQTYFQDQYQQNAGAKKIVRDVRRALGSRKEHLDSPASSHRSTNSSDSRASGTLAAAERQAGPSAWQQLRGPPRVDLLGEKLEASYKEVFEEVSESTYRDPEATEVGTQHRGSEIELKGQSTASRNLKRLDSHVTTGSRSIVIMDDTGIPEMPKLRRAIPSVSTWDGVSVDQMFPNRPPIMDNIELAEYEGPASTHGSSRRWSSGWVLDERRNTAGGPGQDDALNPEQYDHAQARKSSNVHPTGIENQTSRNQLRRRPGGDLKAADHVHDLEPEARPHTGGSYSTFSYSVNNSGVPSTELSGTHFSGHAISGLRSFPKTHAQQDTKNDSLGLLQSQPDVRPSMERQMSQLAKMPDEYDDGDGIENALARLEGKSSSPAMLESQGTDDHLGSGLRSLEQQKPRSQPLKLDESALRIERLSNAVNNVILSPSTDRQGASIYGMSESDAASAIYHYGSEMYGTTTGLGESDRTTAPSGKQPTTSTDSYPRASGEADAAPGSRGRNRDTLATSAASQMSFLLDDNESLSDISTEIADQSGDDSFGVRSFFFDDTVDDEPTALPPFDLPPTPPSTVGAPMSYSPETKKAPRNFPSDRQVKEAVSVPKLQAANLRSHDDLQKRDHQLQQPAAPSKDTERAHLPFVLAFESDVIAEQLTIIEKDAIDEVDWKDLITLAWQQQPTHIRNWVDFLQTGDVNGIDIVIARFNLMVKWVVSECVLTESASERAKCITKYIHIATHTHRLRNYASTYQITLALLSSDLARLQKTWALVPTQEKQTLKGLEKLCQPLRNFSNLRTEMEAITADAACIPFIGLYTHDLTYNAQKPARIDPTSPSKEPLVNFERFQTAATIVKSLLRLIETSSNYIFHPHPEVLSRCLWLASLEDSEITAKSKNLE